MKIKLSFPTIVRAIAELFSVAFKAWYNKDPFRQSAVIAYYAIFGIPGLLVLIVTITGYFFGADTINLFVKMHANGIVGGGSQIIEMLTNAMMFGSTFWGSVVAGIVLLAGATGVFVELQKTLNAIWYIELVPQNDFLLFIKARVFSFGLILAIAFLLLISLIVSTALATLGAYIQVQSSGFTLVILHIVDFTFSLVVISSLFALIFKILPDAKIKWKYLWPGSLLTGILFMIGKSTLAFYFNYADPASIYGAAGSIILIQLWVSYSSMILFYGAEFTFAYEQSVFLR